MNIRVGLSVAAILCLGGSAAAQVGGPSARDLPAARYSRLAPTYGTSALSNATVNGWEFVPYNSSGTFTADGATSRWMTDSVPWVAPVFLPSGASATEIELQGCDDTSTAEFQVTFWKSFISGGSPSLTLLGSFTTGVPDTPGCAYFVSPLSAAETIDNQASSYFFQIIQVGANDGTLRFQAARVHYKLQVSPAPGVATFTDVPTTSPQFQFVEALVAAGITAGCGGGNYCPNQPITRGQMAVFLSVALGLHWPN